MSKEVKTRRNKNVSNALWLVINEMSMLTADTLMLTLQITGLIKTGNGNADLTVGTRLAALSLPQGLSLPVVAYLIKSSLPFPFA